MLLFSLTASANRIEFPQGNARIEFDAQNYNGNALRGGDFGSIHINYSEYPQFISKFYNTPITVELVPERNRDNTIGELVLKYIDEHSYVNSWCEIYVRLELSGPGEIRTQSYGNVSCYAKATPTGGRIIFQDAN